MPTPQQCSGACLSGATGTLILDKSTAIAQRMCISAPVGLDGAEEADLDEGDQDQGQRIVDDAPRHRKVVEGAAVQHLRARLEPGAAVDVRAVGLHRGPRRDRRQGQMNASGWAGQQQAVVATPETSAGVIVRSLSRRCNGPVTRCASSAIPET